MTGIIKIYINDIVSYCLKYWFPSGNYFMLITFYKYNQSNLI